jgi:hypothetical protein
MKRWLIAAGGGLLALTVVLTGVHTTGLAQEEASPATEEGLNEEEDFNIRDAYLEALAAELGITVEDLEAAMNNAQMQVIDRWAQEAKDRVESGEPVFPNLGGILGGFGEGFGIDLPFRELRPGSMTGPDVSIVVGPEMRGAELEGLAEFLGIAEDELRDDLRSGMSLVEIAEANGKTQDELRTYLIEQATEAIDERLQESTDETPETDDAQATPDTSA